MLGITVDDFYKMSPKEFYFALKSKRDWAQAEIELKYRQDYEVARFHALLVINPTLEKGKQLKSPKDLVRFAWEEEEKPQTVEQMKAVMMGLAYSTKSKKKKQ